MAYKRQRSDARNIKERASHYEKENVKKKI